MTSSQQPPNDLFRAARLRLTSAEGDGPPSREEFADRVNRVLDPRDRDGPVTANDIGKIERGIVSYPRQYRRQAYRTVLGVHTDAEIGLLSRRLRPTDAMSAAGPSATVTGHVGSSSPRSPVEAPSAEQGSTYPAPAPGLAIAAPALTLEDLDRIDAVRHDARRYLDETLVAFLDEQLVRCAADDGLHGPRHALPSALGILSIVQRNARSVKWTVRRPLLRLGARAAEFTG